MARTEHMLPLAEEATALLKAFAHPARLMILCQLRDQEMSVGDLETGLEIRQPRLSRELGKLREEGLVTTRKESKTVIYRLSPAPRVKAMVDSICAVMLGHVEDISTGVETGPSAGPKRGGGYGVFARTVQPSQRAPRAPKPMDQ